MSKSELPWIKTAREAIGQKEVPGGSSNPWIVNLWLKIAPWLGSDDSKTPWCGALVRNCLQSCGLPFPKHWYRAKDYLTLPVKLDKPAYGCIVVFEREGGGHVGFVVGQDEQGNLMCLGGNQGDAVNIRPFPRSRVLGYRWPNLYPNKSRFLLPLLTSDGKLSNNEA